MCAEKVKSALRVNVLKRKVERAVALERFQKLLQEKEMEKRRQILKKRVESRAAVRIQGVYRAFSLSKVKFSAAVTIQSAVRCFLQRKSFQYQCGRIIQLQRNIRIWRRNTQIKVLLRFGRLLQAYQHQTQERQTRAAVQIQSAYRRFAEVQRFQHTLSCVVLLQRNFRIVRRQRQVQALIYFYEMLITYQQMQLDERERHLMMQHAAARIQATFRSLAQRKMYAYKLSQVIKIQRNIRTWRRNRQIRALLCFNRMLVAYQRTKAERLQMLRWRVENRAASAIQLGLRSFVHRKRAGAATHIQACVRGWCVRRQRFNFYALKAQLSRLRVFFACWKIELWYGKKLQREKEWKALVAKARWVQLGAAILQKRSADANKIAACWSSYKLRDEISARIIQRREERRHTRERLGARTIQHWWIRLCLKWQGRSMIAHEKKRRQEIAAEEARRLEALAANKARRQAEIAAAEARRQAEVAVEKARRQAQAAAEESRRQKEAAATEARRQEELAAEEARRQARAAAEEKRRQEEVAAQNARREEMLRIREHAKRVISKCVYRRVVVPKRAERKFMSSVQRVQSWWRGMLVRLHQSNAEVTSQRKKISTMTLVTSEPPASSKELMQPEQPLSLGARLEMALHLLLHGKRLQEMLFAGHTIEVCTKYSRECCRRCVKLGIPKTIFAAIRGLNRSRPHVELLHQLLLVLENLTTYQLWDRSNALPGTRLGKTTESVMDDVQAIEALVDLMHIHRDMQQIFALSAKVLKFYVTEMRLHKHAFERNASAMEIWHDAERRLRGLHDLLEKKMAVYAAVSIASKHIQTPSKATASLASRMNPKLGMSILSQLLKMAE